MLTKEEYERAYIRMMDCERTDCKGSFNCIGVKCYDCPFSNVCGVRPEFIYDLIDLVEQWAKDHPVMTNADKFKKVFGHEPIDFDGSYKCPSFAFDKCPDGVHCSDCQRDFWESEYKDPKKKEVIK